MLELYNDWDSVCSTKVRFCLEEKGLEWTNRRIDLCAYQHMTESYLAMNPNGVVPTLVHDGRVLIESSVINEYIDELADTPRLVPADAYGRAKMRVWTKFVDDVLHPAIRPASYNLMIKPVVQGLSDEQVERMVRMHPNPDRAQNWKKTVREPVDAAAIEATRNKADAALDRMERELSDGRPWLVGEQFTLADIACAPMIDRMEWLQMASLWKERPHLSGWIDRIKARPAYARAFPPPNRRLPGPLNPSERSLYPNAAKVVIPTTEC